MTKHIGIVICYFGVLPSISNVWIKSCEFNLNFDFLIFTDQDIDCSGSNVHVYKVTLDLLENRIKEKLHLDNVSLVSAYKLCDFKPMYGVIFDDYLVKYDFWGMCDMDMVFGDLEAFLSDDIFDSYDKIYQLGHFTLYRNTKEVNERFKLKGYCDWVYAATQKENCRLCERGMMAKYKNAQFDVYTRRDYADISKLHKRYQLSHWLVPYKQRDYIKGKYRSGDIVIHFGRENLEWYGLAKDDIEKSDLAEIFNKNGNVKEKCFIGHMAAHVNHVGYEMIAERIFDYIKDYDVGTEQKSEYWIFQKETMEQLKPELEKYISFLRDNKINTNCTDIVGSVAVNANPFTLGHAYLIDEALKCADYLYVFVAEEDLSDFSFEVRYELVKRYCDKYQKVKVLPSGRFFASTITFGDYFNRDALKNVSIDATMDCKVFSTIIAKELGIQFRVLGEEDHDVVTNQYNEFVKEILVQNGVEVIIIPRLRVDGEIVSAKTVRKHIREHNYELLRKEVPETTYRYIIEKTNSTNDRESEYRY